MVAPLPVHDILLFYIRFDSKPGLIKNITYKKPVSKTHRYIVTIQLSNDLITSRTIGTREFATARKIYETWGK